MLFNSKPSRLLERQALAAQMLLTTTKHLRDSLSSVLQKLIPKPSNCSHEYPTLLTLQATRHTSLLPENQKKQLQHAFTGRTHQFPQVPDAGLGTVWAPGGARAELCPWAGQAQSTQHSPACVTALAKGVSWFCHRGS